jgi:hypothetical protein
MVTYKYVAYHCVQRTPKVHRGRRQIRRLVALSAKPALSCQVEPVKTPSKCPALAGIPQRAYGTGRLPLGSGAVARK